METQPGNKLSNPQGGVVTLRLRNSLQERRTLILEPWTTEYVLEPGQTVVLVAEGDLSLPLEIELFEDQMIVYAFDSVGALLSVLTPDGEKLT